MTKTALSLALVAALAGCASDKTRFWTIEPAAGLAPAAAAPRAAPIQVASVHVPIAFDRLEVVRHDEADRTRVLDFDRWSAPPGALIRTALTQDLAALMPANRVIYPDAPAPPGTRRIVVDVLGFRQTPGGYALQLSWSTVAPAAAHSLQLTAPGTADVAGQARALSTMVGQLASDIAATPDPLPAAR